MPSYAAIDIGTNSTKMTVAEVSEGVIEVLAESSKITRLGKGVDKTKRFDDEAVTKTLDCLKTYFAQAYDLGATKIKACGTSAMRDAQNGDEFRVGAAEILGSEVEVITGDREADLTFRGAVSDSALLGNSKGKLLVFDVGGGSTELIVGRQSGMDSAASLDIGAVRLTERILHGDPPTPDQMQLAEGMAADILEHFDVFQPEQIIGTGGTAITIAKMLQPKSDEVQGAQISKGELASLVDRLAAMKLEERRKVPGLEPARADVIVAGMIIISQIMSRFEHDSFIVSTRGVRYGLLMEMAAEG